MSWVGVVSAFDLNESFRSRVSPYLHPLAGRPIVWHVVRALTEAVPTPREIRILHRGSVDLSAVLGTTVPLEADIVFAGDELRALRAIVTTPELKVLVDGASPLLSRSTVGRLVRAAESSVVTLPSRGEEGAPVAIAGEGPALASADDPRDPVGAMLVTPTDQSELMRVGDRHSLAAAAVVMRDRLVREHEARGVTFILPATSWIDVDVRIGPDTLIYPGAVLEGMTEIGSECVIGPYSRIVESTIGRGVELKGWNYVTRTAVKNHAVLEPHARRGLD